MGPSIQLEDIFGRSTNTDTRLQVCPKTMNYRDLTTHQGMVKKENGPVFPNPITQMNLAAIFFYPAVNQQQSVQMDPNLGTAHRALEFNTDSQDDSMSLDSFSLLGNALPAVKPKPEPSNISLPTLMPATHTLPTQMNPAAAEATGSETIKSFFQTPQRSHQTTTNLDKTRRALDFSTGVKQVEERIWASPTTIALETDVSSQDKEKEKEQEAHKLQKIRQASLRAELQQKIQIRQRKVNEVNSSVKACKGSLDAEWVEINSVFSEVIKVVEDARQKALQPLEDRRRKVKKEAQDLVRSLEGEIGQLKKAIDELDKNPDLQVCPPTGLDESKDWTNLSVDTSFSFGTIRTTVSAMMEQIHQKLDQLSPVEHKRIPKFAADVKLDPLTAHQCLVLSVDGKEVRDRGKNQNVPDAPERFDMYGSVLGLNSLTSGKSYWEVEVSNKTGWDLGVTRGDANRKGKLSLNPDNGYWVTVHFKDSEYAALTSPPLSLSLKEKPQKVGVFVDYEEGLVSFYSVTAQSHIYSFTECSFRGEIFPYFSPHLEQNGKNSHPLIISTVGNQ
uniref:B30.2/SPRY domain-containing protein n=2 Tax=Monopterus albus TaxID=43700 RepID=A0A3Q3QDI1_MONAL